MEYTVAPPRKPKKASQWRDPAAEETAKQKSRDRVFGLGEEYKFITTGMTPAQRLRYDLMQIELNHAVDASDNAERLRDSLADAECANK